LDYRIALLAAGAMLITDVLGVVMVQAEARNRGWLAGLCDCAQWLVGITTTTVAVTTLQGHSTTQKIVVVVLVSAANILGTKLGQIIGSHFVTDQTIELRLQALEAAYRAQSADIWSDY